MKALLIVDVQIDFCPGGALPAPNGDMIIPTINRLMKKFPLVVASKDYHPQDSKHFEKWPPHCIAGTEGAEFHPKLDTEISDIQMKGKKDRKDRGSDSSHHRKEDNIDKVFLKGTGKADEAYSAFHATNDDLEKFLKAKKVTDLYITGLTTDYCVKETALDAVKKGFETYVVTDAIAAVNAREGDGERALQKMKKAGVKLVTSRQIS